MTYHSESAWGRLRAAHRQPDAAPEPDGQAASTEPIITETPWPGKLAQASAYVAIVLVYSSGEVRVLMPHDRRRTGIRPPKTMYRVTLGLHHTTAEADLPSQGEAFFFHASISLQWRVLDPASVVSNGVRNVADALMPHIMRQMRRISRTFDITQSAEAEEAINEALDKIQIGYSGRERYQDALQQASAQKHLGSEYGLWTRTVAELSLDEATIGHITKMKQLDRALSEEKAQQQLRKLQEENQQHIIQARIEVYKEIIKAGDTERFALQLASNPDDIAAIEKIMHDDQLISRRETIDFISHMVSTGVIERWEVSDQAREALDWLKEAISGVISDREQQPQLETASRRRRRGRTDPPSQEYPDVEGEIISEDTAVPDDPSNSGDS